MTSAQVDSVSVDRFRHLALTVADAVGSAHAVPDVTADPRPDVALSRPAAHEPNPNSNPQTPPPAPRSSLGSAPFAPPDDHVRSDSGCDGTLETANGKKGEYGASVFLSVNPDREF